MPRPFVLAQLSDPHIGGEWGLGDAASHLAAAVAAAAELRPDAVVVTGDLADHGDPAEYERARELLARLEAPVHVVAGNTDDRGGLRRAFGLRGARAEPVQYDADLGPLRLVVLDTTRPQRDDGELDAARLAWVEEALAAAPDTPTVIAMHHPPMPTGLPAYDAIGLAERDRRALAAIVAHHPQVRRVVTGHVHRAIAGRLGPCPVLTAPSTYVQVRLDLQEPRIVPAPEPLGFAVHLVVDDEVLSHVGRFPTPPSC